MDSAAATAPPPVRRLGLLRSACRTAIADRSTYRVSRRPVSWRRVWRMLVPNLRQPIFLVGAPRSGTTFLGDCLARLPQISYHFEPVATKAAAAHVYAGRWGFARARWLYCTVYAWLARLHGDGDLRFAEKTPQNSFLVPFLYRCFSDARFIHIIRDGRDAALSLREKPWLRAAEQGTGQFEPGGHPFGPYPRFWVEPERAAEFQTTSDLHRCVWTWRRHTEAALHGASCVPTAQYHELRYESLTAQPDLEADRLLCFLKIEDAASRRVFHEAVGQARPDSVGRWKRGLTDGELNLVEAEAAGLLRSLGYSSGDRG